MHQTEGFDSAALDVALGKEGCQTLPVTTGVPKTLHQQQEGMRWSGPASRRVESTLLLAPTRW